MSHDTPEIEVGHVLKQRDDPTITSFHDVTEVYEEELRDEDQENLVAVFLTSSNHVLGDALMFRGSLRNVPVEPREIVRKALLLNAAAVIILHNHPGGDPEPTEADINATEDVHEALDMFNITLLDHVIISPHGCTSMQQDGTLP